MPEGTFTGHIDVKVIRIFYRIIRKEVVRDIVVFHYMRSEITLQIQV